MCPLIYAPGVIFKGNGNGGYKVNDLNVQADAPADDDDDDIDWEEGWWKKSSGQYECNGLFWSAKASVILYYDFKLSTQDRSSLLIILLPVHVAVASDASVVWEEVLRWLLSC